MKKKNIIKILTSFGAFLSISAVSSAASLTSCANSEFIDINIPDENLSNQILKSKKFDITLGKKININVGFSKILHWDKRALKNGFGLNIGYMDDPQKLLPAIIENCEFIYNGCHLNEITTESYVDRTYYINRSTNGFIFFSLKLQQSDTLTGSITFKEKLNDAAFLATF